MRESQLKKTIRQSAGVAAGLLGLAALVGGIAFCGTAAAATVTSSPQVKVWSTQAVPGLTASPQALSGGATASAGGLNFGTATVGAAKQIGIAIRNTSRQNVLKMSNFTVSGGGDFAIYGNGCAAASGIAPGTQCVATLIFSPSHSGSIGGSLSYQDNSTGGGRTINLTGTGE
ncbi:MAG: hypothetical protein ACREQI_15590 [Candidatus Binataceae bacterium]